ncbi:50S ribosomal protein L24 [Candidatus Bathyarchaeota archaeon]|nr:50S ribosomal protein L24 [Candidatus Bathyarchaeota archaeon]
MQTTKAVKDPRKQRKRLYNAPAHIRHKLMAAPLAPDLIRSKGVKTLPVKKGDTVRVVRGDHIGFEGKVSRVDLKRYRIFLEGLTREKVDGTNIFVSVHPSKVIIKNLKLDDKWRKAIVERKKALARSNEEKKGKKAAEKPPAKAVKGKEEKPVEETAVVQEKPAKKPAKPAKKAAQKKTAAKKKTEKKPAAEAKPKKAKKTTVERKAASKTKGGT